MNEFGIIEISIVPVRKEPAESSEQLTQALFGELVFIKQIKEKWVSIELLSDGYLGWVDRKTITFLDSTEFERLRNIEPRLICAPLAFIKEKTNNFRQPIPAASEIRTGADKFMKINDKEYLVEDYGKEFNTIVENAMQFINSSYLWGGKALMGIDCSGLTQIACRLSGIKILRDASQQVNHGVEVNFLEEAVPGDLAFFDNKDKKIIHVGILLGGGKILHASGSVRIDTIDHQGIFNTDRKEYTHKLRIIKHL